MKKTFGIAVVFMTMLAGFFAFMAHHKAKNRTFTSNQFPKINPKEAGLIYQMLKITDALLTKHDIPYWIDGGTVLGAVRHKGLIPWDDDADLVFFMKDEERILALADEFADYGFYLKKEEIIRLFPSKKIRHPYIDLAGYSIWTDQTLRYDLESARIIYSKFYWLPGEVQPLTRVRFGPIELSAPNQMIPYLLRGYGEDCLFTAVFQPMHNPKKPKTKMGIKKVPIVDFNPADYEMVRPNIPLGFRYVMDDSWSAFLHNHAAPRTAPLEGVFIAST
jgi:lipopolysaccharide cholinephosphotransferase